MELIHRAVTTVSTSNADDAAFRALADASAIIEALPDARIVGGQMVALLLAAFPASEAIQRRTADADAAITAEIAATGEVHEALTAAGYRAERGNSYFNGRQEIDLLVPAPTGKFGQEELGGRMFDAAPGIHLALAVRPIVLEVSVLLLDGSTLDFTTRVPTPETATVIKAYATTSRAEAKDLVDLHNLLTIADTYPVEEIGGWALTPGPLTGARLDAARIMTALAQQIRFDPTARGAGVPIPRLTALIRKRVAAN